MTVLGNQQGGSRAEAGNVLGNEATTMIDTTRGTGRTTRMLHEAKALAERGRWVYAVGADAAHAQVLAQMFAPLTNVPDTWAIHRTQFKHRGGGAVEFITLGHPCLELYAPGSPWVSGLDHGKGAVLVDHYTAEQEISALERKLVRLRELAHAYNR